MLPVELQENDPQVAIESEQGARPEEVYLQATIADNRDTGLTVREVELFRGQAELVGDPRVVKLGGN